MKEEKDKWENVAKALHTKLNAKDKEIKFLEFVLEKTSSQLMKSKFNKQYFETMNGDD